MGEVDDHGFGDTSELLRMAQRAGLSFPQARAFMLELSCAPPEQLERMLSRARRMRTAIENTKTRKGIRK